MIVKIVVEWPDERTDEFGCDHEAGLAICAEQAARSILQRWPRGDFKVATFKVNDGEWPSGGYWEASELTKIWRPIVERLVRDIFIEEVADKVVKKARLLT